MSNAYVATESGVIKCEYACDGCRTDVYVLADGHELVYAQGPAKPANHKVSYLLERSYAKCPVYVNVVETYKTDSVIEKVEAYVSNNEATVTVTEKCGKVRTVKVNI